MTNPNARTVDRFAVHAGQLPVIGRSGQQRLQRSRVIVFGTGRVGSSVVVGLHAAGLGIIDGVDPQRIEAEQIGPSFLARKRDVGTPKAVALARFLNRRQLGRVNGIYGDVERTSFDRVRQASLVISCANAIPARIAAERKAIQAGIPIFQVAAFDGREQLGGMITLRHPANKHLACYACIASQDEQRPSGRDGLLTPVTAVLGNVAAHLATLLLAGCRDRDLLAHNVFVLDLERLLLERISVARRGGCEVCGG
ncbi:MAG TPA: ThiF family adenylyltransferase [Bryobacteraceae bacterium]|jgi:molybdopterin/thiamine biosynthesis adenylyltransferase|nr:ThiF family adenylyltransferase [Bryobacteraceae bacterium]